jgi:hypothetical protein
MNHEDIDWLSSSPGQHCKGGLGPRIAMAGSPSCDYSLVECIFVLLPAQCVTIRGKVKH